MSELKESPSVIHVYRMTGLYRGASLVFLAVASFLMIACWVGVATGQREPKLLEMILAPLFPIVGVVWVAFAFTSTVTLFHDAIELRTLVKRTRLPFTGIRGWREYYVQSEDGSTRYLKLEPNDDRLPILEFQQNYDFDSSFYNWFYQLPDLDELDKTKPKKSNFGLV
jgi:hypothetical protein